MKLNAGLIDKLSGILGGAFGSDVAVGFLMGFISDITPSKCYQFIRDGNTLFPNVSDSEWREFSNMAKKANLGDITLDRIICEFRKYRPDLLSVVINHPRGEEWLGEQFNILKSKLQL